MASTEALLGQRVFLGGDPLESFSLFGPGAESSVLNLDAVMIANDITVEPSFLYRASDATATTWDGVYGETVSVVGSGAEPTLDNGAPLTSDTDTSVLFNNAKFYAAGDNTFADLGTDDFVIEALIFYTGDAGGRVCGKRAGSGAGWTFNEDSVNRFEIVLNDGTTNVSVNGSGSYITDSWNHIIAFADRDEDSTNSIKIYMNGVLSNSGNISSVGSVDSASLLSIGGDASGVTRLWSGAVAYVAMWQRNNWFPGGADGPTEWAAIAKERFARLTGVYPHRARGEALPTTVTRNSAGYLDIRTNDVVRLYQVGSNWPRTVRRADEAGDLITGYLAEEASTNLFLRSQTLNTTWVRLDNDDLLGGGYAAPNAELTAWGLRASTNEGLHGISQQATVTAAAYTFSIHAKAGDRDWLYMSDQTKSDADGYFNLATAEVGTVGGDVTDSWAEDLGDGWVRCALRFTGTAADHTFVVASADGDGDATIAGDEVAVNVYLWGAQLENKGHATSYIPTTTATATRIIDQLKYSPTGNSDPARGSAVVKVLMPSHTQVISKTFVAINDGTANNRIDFQALTNQARIIIVDGGNTEVDIRGTTDIMDGVIHELNARWGEDSVAVRVDGVDENTDTSATMPDGITQLNVGCNAGAATVSVNGVLSDLRIYRSPRRS